MLTSNSFPLCPRFRLMEDMLPKDHLKKTRMVVMAALLADPDGGPKTSERVTSLTEYTRKRLIPCLPVLLKEAIELNIVSEIPWREGSIAYNISRRERFSHPPTYGQHSPEMLQDKAYLGTILTGVKRRARSRRSKDDGGVKSRHPPPSVKSPEPGNSTEQPAQVEPPDETHAMTTRFKTLLDKYHETVMTKKHLENLELLDNFDSSPAAIGTETVGTLRQEIVQEAHETLQDMLQDAGRLISSSLQMTYPTISSPCSICFEVMREPQVFPHCGHSFCASCVSELPHVDMLSVDWLLGKRCPMCRVVSHPIPLHI